jgi:hypothetical protein
VQGAAIVWVLRVILDTALLLNASGLLRRTFAPLLAGFSIMLLSAVLVRFAGDTLRTRGALGLLVFGVSLAWTAIFARNALPSPRSAFRLLQPSVGDAL